MSRTVAALGLAIALAGCGQETGILLVVGAPDTQVARLDYHVGTLDSSAQPTPPDACGKRTQLVPMTPVALGAGRDLQGSPYRLLILPGAGGTGAAITVEVLGYDGNGQVVETLVDDGLKFVDGEVIELHRTLQAADRNESWSDGAACFCHAGMPWLAASGDGCSDAVPCAAPATRTTPVCDGVTNNDRPNRSLPCWAWSGTSDGRVCTVSRRTCADTNGVGYQTGCAPDPTAPIAADTVGPTACDLWDACSTASCADPIDCLAQPATLVYTLGGFVDGTTNLFTPCASPAIDNSTFSGVVALLYGNETPEVGNFLHLTGSDGHEDFIIQGGWKLSFDPFPVEKMNAIVPVMKNNRRVDFKFDFCAMPGMGGGTSDGGNLSAPPGELLIVGFEGLRAPDELTARVAAGRVGGVILFARNLGAPSEVAALVDALGRAAPPGPPLIVAIDQEGGRVQRLKSPLTVWPPMAKLAAHDDPALTEAVGRALAAELRLFGINLDFAPVLDVRSNPANQVIGDRAFGESPAAVENQALAFWRGLEAGGVRGCGKHFPGHGDTVQDSHLELPRIESSLAQLQKKELPPFAAAVRAGVPMIMTAHIVFPGVDERPATMSAKWIDGVLRRKLGFRGVVVSDDLDMKAVAGRFPVEEVIRESLAAGVDCFLACRDPEVQRAAEEALARAARDATLGPRVAESIARVRALRDQLAPARPVDGEQLARALPDADHQALAARI